MNLIEREGRIVTVGFGHPDPEGESKWIDDGKTYLTGHGSAGWERDCLVCKEMANKARHKTRNRNQQLVVHVTASADHYNTHGGE